MAKICAQREVEATAARPLNLPLAPPLAQLALAARAQRQKERAAPGALWAGGVAERPAVRKLAAEAQRPHRSPQMIHGVPEA